MASVSSASAATVIPLHQTAPSTHSSSKAVADPELSRAQEHFLQTSTPKEIWLESGTYRITAIENLKTGVFTFIPGATRAAYRFAEAGRVAVNRSRSLPSPMISEHNACYSGDVCLYSQQFPEPDFGFTGTGIRTGTFAHIVKFNTGKWTAEVNTSTGGDTPFRSPNTTVVYGSVQTVVKVYILQ